MIINSLQRHIRLECRRDSAWLGWDRHCAKICEHQLPLLTRVPLHNIIYNVTTEWTALLMLTDTLKLVSSFREYLGPVRPSIHLFLSPTDKIFKKKRKKSRKPKPDDGKSKVSEKEFGTWFSVSFSTLLRFMTATTDPFIQQYCTSSFVGRVARVTPFFSFITILY